MKPQILVLIAMFIVSCQSPLDVSQFHLGEQNLSNHEVKMIRAEANYRYGHHLLTEDRLDQHGHYFNIRWAKSALLNKRQPTTITLYYRQADQGNDARVKSRTIAPEEKRHVEFAITGDEYQLSGKILSWRVELSQGGQILQSEQSFLWK